MAYLTAAAIALSQQLTHQILHSRDLVISPPNLTRTLLLQPPPSTPLKMASSSRKPINMRNWSVKRIMQEAAELSDPDTDDFVAAPLEVSGDCVSQNAMPITRR